MQATSIATAELPNDGTPEYAVRQQLASKNGAMTLLLTGQDIGIFHLGRVSNCLSWIVSIDRLVKAQFLGLLSSILQHPLF